MFKTQLYNIRDKAIVLDNGYCESEVSIVQLKEGDFQVWKPGFLGIILDNILIDNTLGDILTKYVSDQIKLTNTRVIRRATQEIWENYSSLEIFNELELSDF